MFINYFIAHHLRALGTSWQNMTEYAVWTGIVKAPGIVNTSLISLWHCTKDLEKKRSRKQRSKGSETRWEQERNGRDGYYCDVSKMAQIWNWHRQPLLNYFSRLEQAQAIHKHTEQLTTPLGSISFVDATIRYMYMMVANSYKMYHLNS